MAYVVSEACIKCKFTDCVEVCPTDAFREGPNMLVIDPNECVDCGLCVPECPVEAIAPDTDLPRAQRALVGLNAELAALWPSIVEKKPPSPDAETWARETGKLGLLER